MGGHEAPRLLEGGRPLDEHGSLAQDHRAVALAQADPTLGVARGLGWIRRPSMSAAHKMRTAPSVRSAAICDLWRFQTSGPVLARHP
jgi:hypothetical protein